MDTDGRIIIAVKGLSNQIKRYIDRCMQEDKQEDLTGMQSAVLQFVAHSGERDIFQRDIEIKFNIRPSTATGILQLMEKKGYIRREPAHSDGRLKKIVLTEKAALYHRRMADRLYEIEQTILQCMSPEEVSTFFSLIEKISDNLEKL